MATHEPIPVRDKVTNDDGNISSLWHRFLNKIFGVIFDRLEDLETRVNDLENP